MELKNVTDGAKLDILELLSKEEPGIFEFRRVAEIAGLMPSFIDSFKQPRGFSQVEETLRKSEDRAPMLHKALLGEALDGNTLLREKYQTLHDTHSDLRRAAVMIEESAAKVRLERAELDHRKEALLLHEEALERERERLQLEANIEGVHVDLPELPKWDEDEDEDNETGSEQQPPPTTPVTRENY